MSVKSSRSSVVDTSRSKGSKVKDDIERSSSRSNPHPGRGESLPKIGKVIDKKHSFEEYISAPIMFGDPFGNRGDYSKGIFYGGRNKFLHNEKGVNMLEPPLEFMTRRQRKNKWEMSKTQVQLVSKRLDFKRKDDGDEAAILARAEAKKNNQQSKRKVIVIKHKPTPKHEWVLQKQAGCKFWLHKPTGAVSNEKPYTEDDDDNSMGSCRSGSSQSFWSPIKDASSSYFEEDIREDEDDSIASTDIELPPATGSLVYDSSEYSNLVKMLDSMQANR